MSITESERTTTAYYDKSGAQWAETHGGSRESSYWLDEMTRFHDWLPSGRILEIGPGIGKEAEIFIKSGYEYIGIDPSRGLLDIAQRRNPNGEFFKSTVHDVLPQDRKFDGFWAAASLLHVSKSRIDDALKNIASVIKLGGIGFVSIKEGVGETIDDKTGRLFAYYSGPKFEKILERNGFKTIEFTRRPETGVTWLTFIARRV